MLKNILNLEGAQKLTQNEQKSIKGGITRCMVDAIENGCVLIASGATCPPDTFPGACGSSRLCC